ncbi:hypothetical protein LWI28_002101 [Acer negundo]|uniref:Transposase MuDR plant domain-containing protein n=1 Tax=Acer negundo TaxID=4023 RepID=A0AAD5I900_ACENE|nr:hypothetical protein LWI28_002101 [Acer negundo]
MESDLRTVNLKIGQIFGNAKVFKEAVREHAIKQGRSIWFPCNEKFRVQGVYKCKLDNCSWSIWASCYEKNNHVLMIKTLNDKHTCPRVQKNRLANSAWLAKRYTEALRPRKEFNMFDFLGKVRKDYVCQPSKAQVYRAKRKAGLLIEGSLATQYAKLWDYVEEIRRSNLDEIRPKVWEAAKATTVEDFNRVMTKIKDMNEKSYEWLCEKPAEQWSKSHFKDWPKCDMLLNNLCESVNGNKVILKARSAPIFTMLEMIRVKIMNRRVNMRIDMEKWYRNIGSRVAKFMELQAQHSGQFVAHLGW